MIHVYNLPYHGLQLPVDSFLCMFRDALKPQLHCCSPVIMIPTFKPCLLKTGIFLKINQTKQAVQSLQYSYCIPHCLCWTFILIFQDKVISFAAKPKQNCWSECHALIYAMSPFRSCLTWAFISMSDKGKTVWKQKLWFPGRKVAHCKVHALFLFSPNSILSTA